MVRFHPPAEFPPRLSCVTPSMKKTSTNLPRYSFCRKFREDLWGSMLVSPKESNISLLASLLRRHRRIKRSLRLILPPRQPFKGRRKAPPSLFKRQLLERRKVQLFYALTRCYRVKSLLREWRSRQTSTGSDFFSFVETCLSVVLFRSLLARSPMEARAFVSRGNVLVDGVRCFSSTQRIRPGQLVKLTLPPALPNRYDLIQQRVVPPGIPSYLEVSFKSSSVLLLHVPKAQELFFPFKLSRSDFFASFARLAPSAHLSSDQRILPITLLFLSLKRVGPAPWGRSR